MSAVTLFGLRELPRSKGAGYLYVSYHGEHDGMPTAYFDFYKTSDEEHRAIFLEALTKLSDKDALENFELVDFDEAAAVIFRQVAKQMMDGGVV
jgi:hypothetical protein